MRAIRLWLMAVCAGVVLATCAKPAPNAADQAVLPTADVITPPSLIAQVIPLTFTPAPRTAPQTLDTPSFAPSPTPVAKTAEGLAGAAPPNATPAAETRDATALLEAELIVEINKVRQANGLPPYAANPELSAAARAHSCDLAEHHMISHVSSDGRDLPARLAGAAEPWEWPSESIAAGTDDPATVVAWWMDEPPEGWHRRNILDAQQREVGAGYCFSADDPSGNHSYWTADFSRHAASS